MLERIIIRGFSVYQRCEQAEGMAQLGTLFVIQPSEVRLRRNECIKAIKVFEESEKRIRMDPDISKLVRET